MERVSFRNVAMNKDDFVKDVCHNPGSSLHIETALSTRQIHLQYSNQPLWTTCGFAVQRGGAPGF